MNEKLYRFENHDDTPPQKHDPGYGEVIASRGDLFVLKDESVYSVWCGDKIQVTTDDERVAENFAAALRSL